LAVNQLGDGSILWNPPCLKIPADAKAFEKQTNAEEGLRAGDGFRFIRCMVKHEDRITWQCRNGGGDSLIAVKAFKEQDDRDREAACYDALKTLQGVEIPTLLDGEYELAYQKYKHGLILSWVGSEYGGNYMFLPKSALLRAQGIVASMHANGVVHRDLRPENMNYNFTTGKLSLYDLSHAATKNCIGTEAFESARKRDLCVLQELIRRSDTPQAAKAVGWSADWARRTESSESKRFKECETEARSLSLSLSIQ
jgi:tRNA A-37 threonylcarbamoyl transferase component Bud32